MRKAALAIVAVTAAVVGLDAACGSSGHKKKAPGGEVTVKVFDSNGLLLSDRPVVVSDSSGRMVSRTLTDADGQAVVSVPVEGSVTVIYPASGNSQLRTVVAPPPGSILPFLVAAVPAPTPTPPKTVINATFLGAGVNFFYVYWLENCNGGFAMPYTPGTIVTTTASACSPTQSSWDLLGYGLDTAGRAVWWKLFGQPNSFGSTLNMTMTMETAFDSISLGHGALPAVAYSEAHLTWVAGSSGLLTQATDAPGPWGSAPVTYFFRVPHGIGHDWRPSISLLISTAGAAQTFAEDWKIQGGSLAPTYTIDIAGRSRVSLGVLDDSDPARIATTWGLSNGSSGVAAELSIRFNGNGVWHVTLPANHSPSFRLPELPAEDEAARPTSTDAGKWEIDYVDVDALGSYAAYLSTDLAAIPAYVRFKTGAFK